ncbi:MAG: hypothetical protein ACUZ8E_16545 [Candidatus Anammoxibacter sp.]
MNETGSNSYNGESNKELKMDNEFPKLARGYLRKLYELTIESPDNQTDNEKIASIAGVDTSTAKRIVEHLESSKLICSHDNGCITITMDGMDTIINDNILTYVETLNDTYDPTYYSQYA